MSEPETCEICDGTGERLEGVTCFRCGGQGEVEPEESDDFSEPDDGDQPDEARDWGGIDG